MFLPTEGPRQFSRIRLVSIAGAVPHMPLADFPTLSHRGRGGWFVADGDCCLRSLSVQFASAGFRVSEVRYGCLKSIMQILLISALSCHGSYHVLGVRVDSHGW